MKTFLPCISTESGKIRSKWQAADSMKTVLCEHERQTLIAGIYFLILVMGKDAYFIYGGMKNMRTDAGN